MSSPKPIVLAALFTAALCVSCAEDARSPASAPADADDGFDLGDQDAGVSDERDTPDPVEDEAAPPEPVCELGQTRCLDARTAEVCEDEQLGFAAQSCAPEEVCRDGECGEADCVLGQMQCLNQRNFRRCDEVDGFPTLVELECPEGEVCDQDICQPQVCDPDALPTCLDQDTALFCDPPGIALREMDCFQGQICLQNGCQTQLCNPGTAICRGINIEVCNEPPMS